MEGQWLHERHGINLCFSTSSTPPQMNSSIETGTRNITSVPSENVSASSSQARKTIVQKPRRKKLRPKVIKEGKAAKAHKSTTSKPPKEKNKPDGKRKYVRRKEQNTTPTEHHTPSEDVVAHTIVVPTPASRCFNFDGRDQHEKNVDLVKETPTCNGDAQPLTSAVEGSNIQLVQPWCGIGNPISTSVDPMANMVTFVLNNSAVNHIPRRFSNPTNSSGQNFQFGSREQINQYQHFYDGGIPDQSVSHLNSSSRQMQNSSIDLDYYLCVPQSSTQQSRRPDQMLCGYRVPENPAVPAWHTRRTWMVGNFNYEASTRVVNPIPQGYRVPQSPSVPSTCSERNTMNINLIEFATNPNDQIGASFGLRGSRFSDVHAIGKKRGYDTITGHQVSFDEYLEQSNSGRQFYSDPLSTSSEMYPLTETFKRMRSENHSNWLDGFMGNVSSTSANLSGNWNTNNVLAINHGVRTTLGDVQRFMALEKSRSSQQHTDPTLPSTSNTHFIGSCAQHTNLPDSDKNSLGENIVHRNGDHQLESLEIRPTQHYTSECLGLPNKWSGHLSAGHTHLPSETMIPSINKNWGCSAAWAASAAQPTTTVSQAARQWQAAAATSTSQTSEQRDFIPSSSIHQPHPFENQMVKGQDLCQTHKTSTKYVTHGNFCINTTAEQIQRTPIEVRSNFQSMNRSERTEKCHLEASRETTSANPAEKPKVRGQPRKEAEPDGKPKTRVRPRKQAEPDGKPKARGYPRKTTEANGDQEGRDPVRKENDGCELKCGSLSSMQTHSGTIPEIIPSSLDYLEAIIEKLNLLSISMTADNTVEEAPKDVIVPYEDKLGALVPFEGKVKKRGSRAEVKIDPVTDLMWNLLMAPDRCEGVEGMDEDKERFLEEERRVFQGRIDSFIARMHLVQDDRRFSPWKGSVVDSVVGVFLTQNVSDHLSSSAFMALAVKFPVKSEGPEKPAAAEKSPPTPPEQKDSCSGLLGESAKLQGNFFVEEIGDVRSFNTMKDGSLEGVLSLENSAVSPRNFSEYLLNRTYTMGSSSSLVKSHKSVLPTSDLNKAPPFDLNTIYQPAHTPDMQNNSLFGFTDVLGTSFSTGLDHGVNISDVAQLKVSIYQQHPIAASVNKNRAKVTDYSSDNFLYDSRDGSLSQHMYSSFPFEPSQEAECSATVKQSFFQQSLVQRKCPFLLDCFNNNLQEAYTTRTSQMNSERSQPECSLKQDSDIRVQGKTCEKHSSSNLSGNMNSHSDVPPGVASSSIGKSKHTEKRSKARNVRGRTKNKPYDWDNLRKEVLRNLGN
uniref:Uncharacterized protein n=1 Tax=Oryza punctata TaxID=4537 RepID=A0A0E0K005_ORYPU